MAEQRKLMVKGAVMMVVFFAIMISIFAPVFNDKNGLEFLDALYNSISKGSAYYIPELKEEAEACQEAAISIDLDLSEEKYREQASVLMDKAGVTVKAQGSLLHVSGKLVAILTAVLDDSDMMYHNKGNELRDKYNSNEKYVMYTWYLTLQAMEKRLKNKGKYRESKIIGTVIAKAVECSYNYYMIEPGAISKNIGTVIFSLMFYVLYTLWYGFAIMYLFEGMGMKLEH